LKITPPSLNNNRSIVIAIGWMPILSSLKNTRHWDKSVLSLSLDWHLRQKVYVIIQIYPQRRRFLKRSTTNEVKTK
jgi:hypothetical protein